MKKISIILTLIAISHAVTFGQTSTDSISTKQVALLKYKYYQGEKRLNWNQLVKTMQPNEQAFDEMKIARTTHTKAVTFAVGGTIISWAVFFIGGENSLEVAYMGVLIVGVSLPIYHKANKQARKAIDSFNGEIKTNSFWDRTELRLGLTGTGVGFSLTF